MFVCMYVCVYMQGLFEGLKAYRKEDGRIHLFRPEQNAERMKIGAERMCMPCPSIHQFVNAIRQTVLANKRWEGTTSLSLDGTPNFFLKFQYLGFCS